MRSLEERLARNLRCRRGDATQREFARKLGVSVATLNRIEQGQQNVSLATLGTLCKRLKCDIQDLFNAPE
ncbi:MAG: helix-turn-helix transcriptional regulator [Candidatus Hydrogenedentes bacterium]|nr:helix-turn-helix transcriptional regulator [Candidatus Hydrogenedentota bacterium]